MKNFKLITILTSILLIGVTSCELDEELREDLTLDQAVEAAEVDALMGGIYVAMHSPYADQARWFCCQQHTSDETIGPTRAGDWDDNGVWRVLHDHTWNADHQYLGDTFNDLLQVVFLSTDILNFEPTPAQAAEARFLRAFAMLSVVDGWGQVPFREPGENLLNPPQVLSGAEAVDFIISEVEEVLPDLDEDAPTYLANKNAGRVLLMKAYLNKGAFANRESPTFDAADMNKVISYAEDIEASGKYSISSGIEYFDNFAANNGTISKENIFTYENVPGESRGTGNNVRSRWFCTLHYNQNPSGWNGFTTIADFYDTFDPNDIRIGADYPGVTDVSGLRVGMLEGQQYDKDGVPLESRVPGQALAFTKDVKLIETGDDLEITGVRVIKYPPDYNNGDNIDNDIVFYRYSDVILMKAEAILRGGTSTDDPTDLVNSIRSNRNVPDLTNVTLDDLLAERGFEFYWESQRRTDLIRFGKYLDAYTEKPVSGSERLVFPIPTTAVAVNPNLVQNPGY